MIFFYYIKFFLYIYSLLITLLIHQLNFLSAPHRMVRVLPQYQGGDTNLSSRLITFFVEVKAGVHRQFVVREFPD